MCRLSGTLNGFPYLGMRALLPLLTPTKQYSAEHVRIVKDHRILRQKFLTLKEEYLADRRDKIVKPLDQYLFYANDLFLRELEVVDSLPVHGPYDKSTYADPKLARLYDRKNHIQRVKDIECILAGFCGKLIALGDGAGTCYEAVRNLFDKGQKISCMSYEKEQIMRDIAAEYGNVVFEGDFSVPIPSDAVLFLSHVADYYDSDFLYNHRHCKIISFERMTTYHGCWNLVPYRNEWGYALATRGVDLHSVSFLSVHPEVSPIDYSVFGVVTQLNVGRISVSEELPLYIQVAEHFNPFLEKRNESGVARITVTKDAATTIGVPYLGVFNILTASRKSIVASESDTEYCAQFGGYFSDYARYGPRKFLVTSDTVYAVVESIKYMISVKTCGDFTFVTVPRDVQTVLIVNCRCRDRVCHDHVIQIVNKEKVLYNNLINDLKSNGSVITIPRIKSQFFKEYRGKDPGAHFSLIRYSIEANLELEKNLNNIELN